MDHANCLGVDLVSAERQRQICEEGFDAAHDAEYTEGELIQAALYYLQCANYKPTIALSSSGMFVGVMDEKFNWPFVNFKPSPASSPHEEKAYLVKAAALIAAEIDRRSTSSTP